MVEMLPICERRANPTPLAATLDEIVLTNLQQRVLAPETTRLMSLG